MNRLREKWDAIYSPWFTKIIAALIIFLGTCLLTAAGPYPTATGMVISAVIALSCFIHPGAAAFLYVIFFFTSIMHINSAMTGFIVIVILIYCTLGYASVAVMTITPAVIMSGLPEGAYWGLFVVAIFFSCRCREKYVTVFYPLFTALLLMTFARLGTETFLYPNGFSFSKSPADSIETFIRNISFEEIILIIIQNSEAIIKMLFLFVIAGLVMWLVFNNKWLKNKVADIDIRDGIMFIICALIVIVFDRILSASLSITTDISYSFTAVSIILGYLLTRPFASDKAADTLISKGALKYRKAAAIKFLAVKPKASFDTTNVNDTIKEMIKSYDINIPARVLIKHEPGTDASCVADLIACHYGANIVKIDNDVFENLHGSDKTNSFDKIFTDANSQSPSVICFNDADKFFYKTNDSSGEYEKRYHRIYRDAISSTEKYENIPVIFITDHMDKMDDSLYEEGIITSEISYMSAENLIPEAATAEQVKEKERKIRRKTNRAAVIAVSLVLIALGSMLYYFFIYENQQYDIHEASPSETAVAGRVYAGDYYTDGYGSAALNQRIAEIMKSSPGMFFYIEHTSEDYLTVYRTDEETFNEMSIVRKSTVLKKMCKSAETLFNSSYDKLPRFPLSAKSNTNTVFNNHMIIDTCAPQLDAAFGGFEAFFAEHRLALSCDGMTASKLAYDPGYESEDGESFFSPTYYGIIGGNVATVNAVGDISGVSFLPPVGGTNPIEVYISAAYIQTTYSFDCEAFSIHLQ